MSDDKKSNYGLTDADLRFIGDACTPSVEVFRTDVPAVSHARRVAWLFLRKHAYGEEVRNTYHVAESLNDLLNEVYELREKLWQAKSREVLYVRLLRQWVED